MVLRDAFTTRPRREPPPRDVLEHIEWTDENTAQFSDDYGREQTITYK